MAVKFQDVDGKLRKSPLTTEELTMIDNVEEYIDSFIRENYTGESVSIDLQIVDFQYDPVKKQSRSLPQARRKMMRQELEKRYKDAGWKISIDIDDVFDGPNVSGPDYWNLTGKPRGKCTNCDGTGDVSTSERGRAGVEQCGYCDGKGYK